MKFFNKFKESTFRKFIVIISLYVLIILLIPSYKAIFSERLTVDDSFKKEVYLNGKFAGLEISGLATEGVSQKAGLKEKDIVVAVNGVPFDSRYEFQKLLNQTNQGIPAQYTIIRGEIKLIKYVNVYKYFHLIFFVFLSLSLGDFG